MSAKNFVLVTTASLAILASGVAHAASHRHRSHVAHRHHAGGQRAYARDTTEGAYTRSDDRIYGGSYYGYFTSPSYGRFQSY